MKNLNGTRIRVSLENVKRSPVPEEYHYEFRNIIIRKIQASNPSISAAMHDNWKKFFSFSGFLGHQWNTTLGLMFKNVDVVFVSPETEIIGLLKNSILMNPKLLLSGSELYVNSVKEIRLSIPDNVSTLRYETLGEIVIKKGSENNKTVHVGITDNVKQMLEEIIIKQYSAFSGYAPTIEVSITDSKQKKKAIVKDGKISNSFIACRFRFTLKADEEVHRFILTQGIGHHRKMGFGTVGIVKEIENKQ
jgi:CRISPR-associated endoribonuclease Cas6